jgi:hypothetical protein
MKTLFRACLATGTFAFACACAHAATIDWNTWTSATTGTISAGPVAVTFSAGGSVDNLVPNYPSYTPTTTYADGTIVSNAPTSANGILQLAGGNSNVNTVTFSTPVLNPVMAIWSLGASGTAASFVFIDAIPTFLSGGPSAEYGGSSITVTGNTVSGLEGNGTVLFPGTFSSISWTNPNYEFWYGFDVGVAGIAGAVPEPETYALMMAGLALLGFVARRRKVQGRQAA